ncbi:hypothetical protein ACFQ6N_31235 [Kitasatospora sp. NPDC056446]
MSPEHDIGQVIANRELVYTAPDGTRRPVLLELGAPRRSTPV